MRLTSPSVPVTLQPAAAVRSGSRSRGGSVRAPRTNWISRAPVIAAVLALATLAAFPWIASRREARVRLDTAETIAPARQLVRDLAAALALQVAVRRDAAADSSAEVRRRADEAVATVRARYLALGALAPRLGAGFERDVAQLRTLTAAWLGARDGDGGGRAESLTRILAAATRLDVELARLQAQQRERIQSLERWGLLIPNVLVPLLVVALLTIYWTGRRMAALAADAERSRVALAGAGERKVALLRGLTHDLKNSLGAAEGFTRLLRDELAGPLTPLQSDYVTRIDRIIGQTMGAVNDALAVARTEAGTPRVRRRREDLSALVLEWASDYGVAAERAGHTLIAEFADGPLPVLTDAALVASIVGNFLSNAIKYTPAGGHVWLRASRLAAPPFGDEPCATVAVSDTGPGVAPALHERIFEEFYRAPAASRAARGQGIGLATSRRMARLLDGEITLESETGKGATFTLWLPSPRDADGGPAPRARR
jgi:signal transduction histidine kinase